MNFILEYEKFIILSKNIELYNEPTILKYEMDIEKFKQEYLNDEEIFNRSNKIVDFNQDADTINSNLQYYYEDTIFNGIYDTIEDFKNALLNDDIRRVYVVCFIDSSKFSSVHDTANIVCNKINTMSYSEIRSKYIHYLWFMYYDYGYVEIHEGYNCDSFDFVIPDNGVDCYRYQNSDMDKNIEYYKIGSRIKFRYGYRIYDGIILDNNEHKDYFTMNHGINRTYDVMLVDKINARNFFIHHDDIIEVYELDLDLLEYKVHNCGWPYNDDHINFITNYIKSIKESKQ